MEKYVLPRTEIPPRLYRVQYEISGTKETDIGLTASDPSKFYSDEKGFRDTVTGLLASDCIESPVISCFARKDLAEHWMCENWQALGNWTQVLEIDTKLLGHEYVYSVSRVVQELGLGFWIGCDHNHFPDEYFVLHHINARAIVARCTRISDPQTENSQPHPKGSELLGKPRSLSQASWTSSQQTLPLEAWYASSPSTSRVSSVLEGSNYGSVRSEEAESEGGFSGFFMPRLTAPGLANLRASSSVSIPGSVSASEQDETSVDGNSEFDWPTTGSTSQTAVQSRVSSVRSYSTRS